MNCSRCGVEIPPNSRFCPSCGNPIEMSAGAALEIMRAQKREEEKKRKQRISIIAILIAILVMAVVILLMILGRGRVVEAPPVPPPPPPAAVKKTPQEIVDYIAHVKQTEDQRVKMKNDVGPALEMLKAAQSMQYDVNEESHKQNEGAVTGGLEEYTKKWQDIVASFNTVPAPMGCEKLGAAYSQALGKYSQAMINIQQAFYSKDLSALMAMQGTVQTDVDSALVQADQELAAVCKEYDINKTFSITPDKQSDTLMLPGQ